MKRFDPTTYNPNLDSSDKGKGKLDTVRIDRGTDKAPTCACGCGQTSERITAGKSRFLQGHDARFMGVLIRAYLANVELTINGKVVSALDEAKAQGWIKILSEAKARHAARPVPRKRSTGVKASDTPKSQGKATETAPKGSDSLTASMFKGDAYPVKVGRHTLDGVIQTVYSDAIVVEYKTKGGETKTKTVKLAAPSTKGLSDLIKI